MISKTQPLSDYVAQYRDGGVDVAAFPTRDTKRLTLRIVDPEDKETGLAFLASFSKNVKEADLPSDEKAQTKANQAMDAILNDNAKMAKFQVCFCVIDAESLSHSDTLTEDDLGREFISVSYTGTAKSLSYKTYEEAKSEAKRKSVRK